ncbi:MAG: protein kinase [Acidobacteriaceae bacterium]|nr:protein kinase [Acidobacteriaceae bacterium]MBV9778628.1 protein kinase [Acidobacteriaceae bacterium]
MAVGPQPARDKPASKGAPDPCGVASGTPVDYTETSGVSEQATTPVQRRREPLLQPGDVLDDRFVIVKLLGSGGMGEVYEAEDLNLHRAHIALKTIRPDYALKQAALDRFKDEVLLARDIPHPNICPVREIFSCQGPRGGEIWFLTMKLLQGETLSRRLKGGSLGAEAALQMVREIGAGLDAIHKFGIVHRDLKPSNVFLEKCVTGERAVLMDFGIAHVLTEESLVTDVNHVPGTPPYMAPEVLTGKPATVKSDVYSFGVVLHEMLIGGRPDSVTTVDAEARREDARTRRARSVISRCLAHDPDSRFGSAGDVAAALQAAYEEPGVITRRRLFAAGAAVALGGGAWLEREEIYAWLHPIPRPRRVAVLPATDAHPSSEDASLLNGVLETVSGELARVEPVERDLFVVPPRYMRDQKVTSKADVLALFGANLVLTGSLERLRDSVALLFRVENSAGKVFRDGNVVCALDDLFALPRLALNRAAFLLDIEHKDLLKQSPTGDTQNPEAFAAYERARGLLRGFGLLSVDQAIAELQKAVDLDPHFARAYALLSEAYSTSYHRTNDAPALEVAERNSNKSLELAPQLSLGYSSRGRVELYRGLYSPAIQDLGRALALDTENSDAQVFLAEAYVKSGKLDLAEKTYERVSKERPNDWFAINHWGDFCLAQAQYPRAERLFREATIVAPQAALPWRNLGAVYLAMGRLEEADEILSRSIALLPSGDAYTNLGTALFWQGKYREAADSYLKATKLDPKDHLMWRNLGDAHDMMGDHERAKQEWRKAANLAGQVLEVNPNDLDTLTSLALYRAKLDEHDVALELLRRANTSAGLTTEQLFREVLAYEKAGERATALRLLRECVRSGYSSFDIMRAPELQNLRKDPRFKSLGVKLG